MTLHEQSWLCGQTSLSLMSSRAFTVLIVPLYAAAGCFVHRAAGTRDVRSTAIRPAGDSGSHGSPPAPRATSISIKLHASQERSRKRASIQEKEQLHLDRMISVSIFVRCDSSHCLEKQALRDVPILHESTTGFIFSRIPSWHVQIAAFPTVRRVANAGKSEA